MRKIVIAAALVLRACATTPVIAEDIGNNSVCFVPGLEDCAMVAATEIEKVQQSIQMQAYQYTEPHIAQAILDAKGRGVDVQIIVDKTAVKEKNGQALGMSAAGIPVWVDYKPRIAHNKVIVIDAGKSNAEVMTGSFNWTVSADTKNSENLLVIRDAQSAAAYEQNFESRLAASETLAEYEAGHRR